MPSILIPTVRSGAVLPSLIPKDIIDLSQWRLDIPENDRGELFANTTFRTNDPDEPFDTNPSGDVARSTNERIEAPELAAGYNSPYFFGSLQNGRRYVNMKCPIFGSTSTPLTISNNARSELRGLLTAGGSNAVNLSFRGINRPKISGRWKLVQSSSSSGSGTSDICQIHPSNQEPGYTGPVGSGDVFVIMLWRKSSGRLESAVRDVTNPDLIWDSGQEPADRSGRLYLMEDFRVGDELEYTLEWDCRTTPNVLKYTLQKIRDNVNVGSVVNINHQVQSGWASRYNYFKAGAYSSTNILDSLDAKEDPAPSGFPSRNTGGLLLPENVTDVNWVAFADLTQQLMNPTGAPE